MHLLTQPEAKPRTSDVRGILTLVARFHAPLIQLRPHILPVMMPLLRILLLVVAFAFAVLTTVRAQEVQIPLDESGQLTVVDAALESRLALFPSYENFREARLFRQGEGAYVLVIQYVQDAAIVQDRQMLSDAEVESLRERITQALTAANVRPALDQEGRVSLLWTAAGMSLLAYGPSLVAVLDINDETPAATVVLLTGAAGFFVPYFATRSIPVSAAAGALTRSGSLIGYAHGVALAALLGGERLSERGAAGAGMAVSLGEALAAYHFATSTGLARGAGETMTSGSLFGAGFGVGTAVLLLGEDFDDEDTSIRVVSGLGLVGSALGAFGGYRLTRIERYSRGDARILSTAGLLGFETGTALVAITESESARPIVGMVMAGTAAGLVSGHVLTRGRDFSTSQGNFVALGTLAGGLVGAAAANVVGASTATDAVLTTLGSVVGFGAMYYGYRSDALDRAGRSLDLSIAPTLDPVNRSVRTTFRLRAGL